MVGGVRRKLVVLALVAIPGAGLLASAPAAAQEPGCPDMDTPSGQMQLSADLELTAFNASVICLINQQRAAVGEKPLRPNGLLQDAAFIYSTSMLSGRFFGHHGSVDGRARASSPIKRLKFLGYIPPGKRWIVGEDLRQAIVGTDTPNGVVQAWMNSPPHRERILKAKFEDIGVSAEPGIADSFPVTSGVTVAAEFGFRRFPK